MKHLMMKPDLPKPLSVSLQPGPLRLPRLPRSTFRGHRAPPFLLQRSEISNLYFFFVATFSLSLILKNYSINGIGFLFTESSFLSFFFLFCNDLCYDALVFRQQCPVEALPLSQGIPLKSMIWDLRRKVHHLTKKSKKMDDELHRLRKSHSEATAKVTRLRDLHKKGFMDYTRKKADFVKKLEELQKCASDRS